MIKKILQLAIFSYGVCALAQAVISVTPMILNLYPPKQAFNNIMVKNLSNTHKAYVMVSVSEILNPGTEAQKELAFHDQDPFSFGLAVAPSKIIIPPNGERAVRVVALGQLPTVDRSYVITFTPSEGVIRKIKVPGQEGATMGLQIIEAFGVRVFVRPQHAKAHLQLTRSGKQLIIKNTGNTNALVSSVLLCKAPEEAIEKCENLGLSQRLYAGNTWEVNLPKALPVKVKYQEGDASLYSVASSK